MVYITHCPTCRQVVHHNHRCPGNDDPPTPLNREQFDRWVAEARAERRAREAAEAQQLLPVVQS